MLKHLGLEPRDLAKFNCRSITEEVDALSFRSSTYKYISRSGQIGKVSRLRTDPRIEIADSSSAFGTINKERQMSSQYNISNRKPQKILFDTYREYRIYKIIDARNNVYYNAESDYLTQGLIDATGNTIEVLQAKIDKIYARVHLLNMINRSR